MRRKHRDDEGGEDGKPKAKVFKNQAERDAFVESMYTKSQAFIELTPEPFRSTLATISDHAPALADLFWRERADYAPHDAAEALLYFEAHHLGRHAEEAAHGILLREVLALEHGKRRQTAPRLFVSAAEEQHWRNCRADLGGRPGKGEESLRFCDRVAALAEGREVPEPIDVEARVALLQQQADELRQLDRWDLR